MTSPRITAAALGAALLLAGSAPADAADAPTLGPSVLHVPVERQKATQGILTPVPISLDLPPSVHARRVLVHYKVWGWPEWTTLELTRVGSQRWIGAIPCLEVSTITGNLIYYIRAHDRSGAVVAYSGSRARPYQVTVVHDSVRKAAEDAPNRCPDPSDCPPGLPGCPSAEVERVPCESDADCEGGLVCTWEGYCGYDDRRRHWISVELSQDAGLVPTASACTLESQENEGYGCYRRDSAVYRGNPVATNEPLRAGWGPTRALFGYEYLLFYNSSVGVRLGYAWRGEGRTLPRGTRFVPYSGELRFTHWLGDDPFYEPRLRPYLFLNLGYMMVDIPVTAHVREDVTRPVAQGGNDFEQELRLWKRAGDGFVGAGAGVTVPLGASWACSGELSVMQVFPFAATVVAPRVGVRHGF